MELRGRHWGPACDYIEHSSHFSRVPSSSCCLGGAGTEAQQPSCPPPCPRGILQLGVPVSPEHLCPVLTALPPQGRQGSGSGLEPGTQKTSWGSSEEAETLRKSVEHPLLLGPPKGRPRTPRTRAERLVPGGWPRGMHLPDSCVLRVAVLRGRAPLQGAALDPRVRGFSAPRWGEVRGTSTASSEGVGRSHRALSPWGWAGFTGQEPGVGFWDLGSSGAWSLPQQHHGGAGTWWEQLFLRPIMASSQSASQTGSGRWKGSGAG